MKFLSTTVKRINGPVSLIAACIVENGKEIDNYLGFFLNTTGMGYDTFLKHFTKFLDKHKNEIFTSILLGEELKSSIFTELDNQNISYPKFVTEDGESYIEFKPSQDFNLEIRTQFEPLKKCFELALKREKSLTGN